MQAADLDSDAPMLNTEWATLEGRSADAASSSMISAGGPVTPLSPGSAVVIQGLKGAPQHIGKEGRLIELLPDEDRWVVQLVGEEQPFKIKEENFELLCSSPEEVGLLQSRITDAGMECVAAACSQLSSRDLEGCFEVTDEGVGKLAAGCPQLSSLNLEGCSEVTEEGVGKLAAGWHADPEYEEDEQQEERGLPRQHSVAQADLDAELINKLHKIGQVVCISYSLMILL